MKTRIFFALLLMAATGFCWTACSDKEDNESNADGDKSAADYVMTPAQIADYAAENFITHVCKVEIDEADMKLKSWEVNYGRVLHPETPNVRYTRALSQEDALQQFQSMICTEASVNSIPSTGEMTVDMGSHGSVKYSPVNQNGEWARVEVNLKELPELQTIVFCKPEAWPENAGDCGVLRESVFKRNEEGHDVYYICIRESSETGTGYLIGFDTWTIEGSTPDHTYRGRNCYHAWWGNCPGGVDLIRQLRGFLYNRNGEKYDKAENIIRQIGRMQGGNPNNTEKCGDDALYNFLYSNGKLAGRKPFFRTGDDNAWIDTHHSIILGDWHWILTPYTMMEPTQVYSSKIAYECDEIDPNTHNGSNTHTCNVEQNNNWGNAWAVFQFGAEWIWKVNEWYSFQKPFVIVFQDTDAADLQDFMSRYQLTKVDLL